MRLGHFSTKTFIDLRKNCFLIQSSAYEGQIGALYFRQSLDTYSFGSFFNKEQEVVEEGGEDNKERSI